MAINPATPALVLEEILPQVDQVLVMTVNPGFGHQHFLHETLPKIGRVQQMIERINQSASKWTAESTRQRAPLAVEGGANVLVAGTAIFGEGESAVAAAMKRLRAA